MMRRRFKALGVSVAALLVATLSGCAEFTSELTEEEVVAFIDDALVEAAVLDHVAYCDTFASNKGFCEDDLRFDEVLPTSAELACWERLHSQSFAVRVTSVSREGQQIRSDIQVARDGSRILAVNPVWWVGRGLLTPGTDVTYPGQASFLDDCA